MDETGVLNCLLTHISFEMVKTPFIQRKFKTMHFLELLNFQLQFRVNDMHCLDKFPVCNFIAKYSADTELLKSRRSLRLFTPTQNGKVLYATGTLIIAIIHIGTSILITNYAKEEFPKNVHFTGICYSDV